MRRAGVTIRVPETITTWTGPSEVPPHTVAAEAGAKRQATLVLGNTGD